jgi:hypothetical protein
LTAAVSARIMSSAMHKLYLRRQHSGIHRYFNRAHLDCTTH